jgi:RHS repeat-associated protein
LLDAALFEQEHDRAFIRAVRQSGLSKYDKNGSLTDLVQSGGTTKFAYNAAGQIARIRWENASSTYFFYDALLQRFGMVAAGTPTYFLWDGMNLLQELNADGTVKEEHAGVRHGIAQLLETYRPASPGSDQKIYPLMDPRGSIVKWMKSDGTTVLASREYDAFGRLIPNAATGTWPGRFGYEGQTWIEIFSSNAAQRLLLSPFRLYDPTDGRFVQNEPLLGRRAFSQFLYARQNPPSLIDPWGLQEAGCECPPTAEDSPAPDSLSEFQVLKDWVGQQADDTILHAPPAWWNNLNSRYGAVGVSGAT